MTDVPPDRPGIDYTKHAHADLKVPPHIHRLAHYFHSLGEIYEFYRGLGQEMPKPIRVEMMRAEAELIQALEEESSQGGVLREFYEKLDKKEKQARQPRQERRR